MSQTLAQQFSESTYRKRFTDRLPEYLPRQRWFTAKGKGLASAGIERVLSVTDDTAIVVIRLAFDDGSVEYFQMPIAELKDGAVEEYAAQYPQYVAVRLPQSALVDAVPLLHFRTAVYELIHRGATKADGLTCEAGRLLFSAPASSPSTVPALDTSNTAIVYSDRYFFKLFRKLDEGLNPDLELVRHLSERAGFEHCPPYGGSIGVGEMGDEDYLNLGMMSGKVDNRGDAWEYFQTLTEAHYAGEGEVAQRTMDRAALLGKRTAQMHLALHGGANDTKHGEDAGAGLRPEAMSPDYRQEITAAARKLLSRQMTELKAKVPTLNGDQVALAERVLKLKSRLDDKLRKLADRPMELDLIRIHGDYHLGQVLVTDDDYYIIDFEGEPLLSIPERRRKRPALKDVAGMVRSFHYAAHGQLLLNRKYGAAAGGELQQSAERWFDEVSGAFLRAYYSECGGAPFLPEGEEDRELLLDLFTLEKAIYEVAYELNSRPAWLSIPLRGVVHVLGKSS